VVLFSLLCVKYPPPPLVERPKAHAGKEAIEMEREEMRRREKEAREKESERRGEAQRKRRSGGIVAVAGEKGGLIETRTHS
jgi:hypothetical protein